MIFCWINILKCFNKVLLLQNKIFIFSTILFWYSNWRRSLYSIQNSHLTKTITRPKSSNEVPIFYNIHLPFGNDEKIIRMCSFFQQPLITPTVANHKLLGQFFLFPRWQISKECNFLEVIMYKFNVLFRKRLITLRKYNILCNVINIVIFCIILYW